MTLPEFSNPLETPNELRNRLFPFHAFYLQALVFLLEEHEPRLYESLLSIQQQDPRFADEPSLSVRSDIGVMLAWWLTDQKVIMPLLSELYSHLETQFFDVTDIWNEHRDAIEPQLQQFQMLRAQSSDLVPLDEATVRQLFRDGLREAELRPADLLTKQLTAFLSQLSQQHGRVFYELLQLHREQSQHHDTFHIPHKSLVGSILAAIIEDDRPYLDQVRDNPIPAALLEQVENLWLTTHLPAERAVSAEPHKEVRYTPTKEAQGLLERLETGLTPLTLFLFAGFVRLLEHAHPDVLQVLQNYQFQESGTHAPLTPFSSIGLVTAHAVGNSNAQPQQLQQTDPRFTTDMHDLCVSIQTALFKPAIAKWNSQYKTELQTVESTQEIWKLVSQLNWKQMFKSDTDQQDSPQKLEDVVDTTVHTVPLTTPQAIEKSKQQAHNSVVDIFTHATFEDLEQASAFVVEFLETNPEWIEDISEPVATALLKRLHVLATIVQANLQESVTVQHLAENIRLNPELVTTFIAWFNHFDEFTTAHAQHIIDSLESE